MEPRTFHSYNDAELQLIQEKYELMVEGKKTRQEIRKELSVALKRSETGIDQRLRALDRANGDRDRFTAKQKHPTQPSTPKPPPPVQRRKRKLPDQATELRRLDADPSIATPRVSTRRTDHSAEGFKVTRSGISFWVPDEPLPRELSGLGPPPRTGASAAPKQPATHPARRNHPPRPRIDQESPSSSPTRSPTSSRPSQIRVPSAAPSTVPSAVRSIGPSALTAAPFTPPLELPARPPARVTPREDTLIRNAYYLALQEGVSLDDCVEHLQEELGRARNTILRRFAVFAEEMGQDSDTMASDGEGEGAFLSGGAQSDEGDHSFDTEDSGSEGGLYERRRPLVLGSSGDDTEDSDSDSDGDGYDRAVTHHRTADSGLCGGSGRSQWPLPRALDGSEVQVVRASTIAHSAPSRGTVSDQGSESAERGVSDGGALGSGADCDSGGRLLKVLTLEELLTWSGEEEY